MTAKFINTICNLHILATNLLQICVVLQVLQLKSNKKLYCHLSKYHATYNNFRLIY